MYSLFYVVIFLALFGGFFGLAHLQGMIGAVCIFLCIAYAIAAFVPGLACAVRRLHDTNRTGWWILLGLIPVINIVLIVLLALDGTPGDNRYGANPKVIQLPAAIG